MGLPKDTVVVLFRKFKLKAKQTMDSAKAALVITSEKLKARGSQGGTYFWNPGPGAAPSIEDSFLVTRWFPSVEAWGSLQWHIRMGIFLRQTLRSTG